MIERPSTRALLKRDHPGRTFGGFALLFGLGAIGALIATAVDAVPRESGLIFAGVFGAFTAGVGFVFVRRLLWLRRLATDGVVVDGVVRIADVNSEDVWYLGVDYEFDGERYYITQGMSDKPRFAPGDKVRLLVEMQRPDKAWIAEV